MSLTVVTRATTLRLTTRERMKLELPTIPASSDDELLDALIDAATGAVQAYCNRAGVPFARQAYTETLGAFGDTHMMLKGTPIVVVSSVLLDGAAVTDYTVEDAAAGLLNRRFSFFATAQRWPGLGGRQSFPAFGSPIPGAEELRYSVSYVAGHLMPGQDLKSKTTISAATADNSFNDSDAGFPALLKAGDTFTMAGFATSANNGRFTATGTPTTSKVVVAETVSAEVAGASITATFRTLPADLEQAAVETVKAWYLDREKSPHTKRERVGATDTEWADPVALRTGLPATAVGFLRSYMRAA